MGVLSALMDNKIHNFEQAFGSKDITTSPMKQAIKLWFSMYFDVETTEGMDGCHRIPVAIVNKLYKTTFSEYEVTINGGKQQFMNRCLANLEHQKKKAMQMALIGGKCFIKPIPMRDSFQFNIIRRDCFIPLSVDDNGRNTSIGTIETTFVGDKYYFLLEKRTVDVNGFLTIESKLFSSTTKDVLGFQVPLDTLEKYAELKDVLKLPKPTWNLGMVPLCTPMENMIDGSPDCVSIYAAAVDLIQNVNRNEWLLDREFENGASRIIASEDMLSVNNRGEKKLADDLFVGVDDDPDSVGITIFSPNLREASYLARKQELLRNIESLVGLKRGILSEVEAAERTATEITSSAGDYNLTIQDFQSAWEDMLRELMTTCDILGQMYGLCNSSYFDSERDLVIDWGDGVLFNRDKVWSEYTSMVAAGLLKPELAIAWYFNLPHETPADLEKIRMDYMPEIEQLMDGE